MSGVRDTASLELPRGGVTLRFWVEPLGPHTQYEPGKAPRRCERGREDLSELLRGFRWVLIFHERGEITGFRSIADAKAYCERRWAVTEWRRDWTGDWIPEDGNSWVSDRGELWPGVSP